MASSATNRLREVSHLVALLEADERGIAKRGAGHSIMTFREKASRPHLFVTYCAIGAFVGTIESIYAGAPNTISAIEGVFVWTGCLVMLRHAWAKKPNWTEMLKSHAFWVGVALIATGNILFWLGISKQLAT